MRLKRLRAPWIIIIIALALVAMILLLGYQSFKATEKATFYEFNQRQLILAKEANGGIELFFEGLAGDLKALGGRPEIQHLDEARTRQEMQRTFEKVKGLGVNDIGLLDENGVLRFNVAAPEIEGESFSWRRYYQEAAKMTSYDTYIIEFIEFTGVDAGRKGVLVAVPMFETAVDEDYPSPSGEFAGVIVGTLTLDTITRKFVAPIQSSESGHAILIDDEYHVLWAPDSSLFGKDLLAGSEQFPAFQQMVYKMGTGESGAGEYAYHRFDESSAGYSADKEEDILAAFAPVQLGNASWVVGVWAPKDDARRLIRSDYLRQLLIVGAGIVAIVLGSSYALIRSLRTSRILEQEVAAKTGELGESHQRLRTALDRLEAAHAFQQSIIDGVAESIMVIDPDYRVTSMNRAAREFSFGDADSPEPVFCYQISHRGEAPCKGTEHPCPMEQVRESGLPVTVVHEHCQKGGEHRFVELIASPLWGPDGAFQGIIECMRDISERKQAEEALLEYAGRLRALTGQLAEVREAERQQLARELHDQVGQNLTALGINLNIVRSQMLEDARATVGSRLDDSLSLVEQTAERIRDVMANLRPPVLDDYGLVAALHWYGEQFAGRTDTAVTVRGEETVPRLAPRFENAMFRIAQEALTNVAKHARATQVIITVDADAETVRLVIADNGVGFDPTRRAECNADAGWGLLTMSERAEAVGGRCRIESIPGQGARVIVEVAR